MGAVFWFVMGAVFVGMCMINSRATDRLSASLLK